MAVEVRPEVRQMWEDEGCTVGLLLRSDAPLRKAHAAMDDASMVVRSHYTGSQGPLLRSPVALPFGVGMWAEIDATDLDFVLSSLCAQIEAAGVSGELTTLPVPDSSPFIAPYANRPNYKDYFSVMECHVGFVGSPHESPRLWNVDPVAVDKFVDTATRWCAHPRSSVHLNAVGYGLQVTIEQALRSLHVTLDRTPMRLRLSGTNTTGLVRQVNFDLPAGRAGLAVVVQGSMHDRWADALDVLRQVVVSLSPLVQYAFIKRGSRPQLVTADMSLTDSWVAMPHVDSMTLLTSRGLDASRVPDAFGVQILTDHLETWQPPAVRWRSETLADGRILVEHIDPQAWFAQPLPDLDVVRIARHDFEPILLTSN